MKSKHQISSFLKMVTASEKDALAIESYLSHRGIYLNFPEQAADKPLENITFERFKEWLEDDLPEQGEAIVAGNLLGIVKKTDIHSFTFAVSFMEDGNFITGDLEIPVKPFRRANGEEILRLQRELNARKLSWNSFKNAVIESFSPVNNLQVRLSRLGKRMGIGVFREINEKGEIVMYCLKETDKPVSYSLCEVIGPASDYQFEAINSIERKKLISWLEAEGKLWNGHAKRIEPVFFRVEKGAGYFYVSDYLEVIATTDHYKPKDRKRLIAGNYFRTRDEAEIMRSGFVDKRNQLLIHYQTEVQNKKTRKKKGN